MATEKSPDQAGGLNILDGAILVGAWPGVVTGFGLVEMQLGAVAAICPGIESDALG